MDIAVLNYSGNVGKTTVARHLLQPRLGVELIAVETINADETEAATAIRGKQFAQLQEYMLTTDGLIVDIGASNVEEFLQLMRRYRGSHSDFDYFIVPTVPALKQQKDTVATLAELERIGVTRERVRLVFNQAEEETPLDEAFGMVWAFCQEHAPEHLERKACIFNNELYGRIRQSDTCIKVLAEDQTDYKRLIGKAADQAEKLSLAQRLATQRLASGVWPQLNACFDQLQLQ
jgi:hypothetical protein